LPSRSFFLHVDTIASAAFHFGTLTIPISLPGPHLHIHFNALDISPACFAGPAFQVASRSVSPTMVDFHDAAFKDPVFPPPRRQAPQARYLQPFSGKAQLVQVVSFSSGSALRAPLREQIPLCGAPIDRPSLEKVNYKAHRSRNTIHKRVCDFYHFPSIPTLSETRSPSGPQCLFRPHRGGIWFSNLS